MKSKFGITTLLALLVLTIRAQPPQVLAAQPDAAVARAALLRGALLADSNQTAANLPGSPLAPIAPETLSGTLVFSSDRAGSADLYTQAADGSAGAVLLENGPGAEFAPVWSPDGTQVVFSSDRDGDAEIFRRDAAGQVSQLTFNASDDIHPAWAPDGDGIIFSSDRGGLTFDIYTMDLSDGNVEALTAVPGQNLVYPRWSPDGTRIAYMQASIIAPLCTWNWDVWLMAPDGGSRQRLTTQLGADLYPNWSPDGSQVLYASCRAPYLASDLYRRTVATGVDAQLTSSLTTSQWAGVYAPDGQHIAYSSDETGNDEILIMPAAGGSGANLTQNDASDLAPSWSGGEPAGGPCALATAPTPLVFITGWGGSKEEEELGDDDQLRYFDEMLAPYGYREHCNLFYVSGTTPKEDLAANGETIAEQLCVIRGQIGANYRSVVDIVAHSYGGLRARAFLENPLLYNATLGHVCPGGAIKVGHLFTLGTPHLGEYPILPFAIYIGANALRSGDEWPAIYEMLPPVRLWQTITSRQPANVCYHLIGGDARLQATRFNFLLRAIYDFWTPTQLLANDFAVHYFSASGLLAFPDLYPATTGTPTIDLHGHVPRILNSAPSLRSYVFPDDTFAQAIWPAVGQTPCAPVQERTDESALTASALIQAQQQPRQSAALPLLEVRRGALSSGAVVTGTFDIFEPGQMQVALAWPAGEVTLALADPAGQPLSDADPHVSAAAFDTGYGMLSTFVITQTLTGTYHYTATAGVLSAPAGYRLVVRPPAPAALQASVPEWSPAGATVVLTATVTVAGPGAVTGTAISGTVTGPDAAAVPVVLLDDGQHQDGAPGDGVFGMTYPAAAGGGLYSVQLQASGLLDAVPFQRSAGTFFFVGSAGAALTAQYGDAAEDLDGDGFYDALVVSTTLDVTLASTYTLSAELYAGDHFITQAATRIGLAPGTGAVALRFDGLALQAAGLDGPYTVRNVWLFDEGDGTVLITGADEVHQTAFYRAAQFGRPYRLFLPAVVD